MKKRDLVEKEKEKDVKPKPKKKEKRDDKDKLEKDKKKKQQRLGSSTDISKPLFRLPKKKASEPEDTQTWRNNIFDVITPNANQKEKEAAAEAARKGH